MLQPDDLRLPDRYTLFAGADTGTYMGGIIAAISSDAEAFILEEFPNYRYVGGEIELLGLSLSEWAYGFRQAWARYTRKDRVFAWADQNTQFRAELLHHGIVLAGNPRGPEVRVEISREYFQQRQIHLTPWLKILPYEIEHARWPDEMTSAGKYERLKVNDHTLVSMEHILSRRPRSPKRYDAPKPSFLDQMLAQHQRPDRQPGRDIHLGAM